MKLQFFGSEDYTHTRSAARRGLKGGFNQQNLSVKLRMDLGTIDAACEFLGFVCTYQRQIKACIGSCWMAQRTGQELGDFIAEKAQGLVAQYGLSYPSILSEVLDVPVFTLSYDSKNLDVFFMIKETVDEIPVLTLIVEEEEFEADDVSTVTPFLFVAGLASDASINLDVQVALLSSELLTGREEDAVFEFVSTEISIVENAAKRGESLMLQDFIKYVNVGDNENNGKQAFYRLFFGSEYSNCFA